MNDEVSIGRTIKDDTVAKSIRYRLAYSAIRKKVLAVRPKSERELKKRIEDYLQSHPRSAMIFQALGVTKEKLVSKMSQYAK